MQLIVGNVVTKVISDKSQRVADRAVLYACLSYTVPGHEHISRRMSAKWHGSGEWDGVKSYYNRLHGVFLTGFLEKVVAYLDKSGLTYTVHDARNFSHRCPSIESFGLSGVTLRPYQQSALKSFLGHKVGNSRFSIDMPRGVVHCPTGGGKTEIAAALIRGLRLPTLFLTHRVKLFRQTTQRFIKRMPEMKTMIGTIGNGDDSPKFITVATVQTLQAMMKRDPVKTKALLAKFQVLIIDEAHRSGAYH